MYKQASETFFKATAEAFRFLEERYGYRRLEGFLQSANDGRITTARIRYVGSQMGVEIWWSPANARLGVVYIELQQSEVFPHTWSLIEGLPNTARAVSLYELAEMAGRSDDPDFLVKDLDYPRKHNKRAKMLETRMQDVLAGLARATQTYASDILQGDTTLFPEVMAYATSKVR
jgi:hypothetical protein